MIRRAILASSALVLGLCMCCYHDFVNYHIEASPMPDSFYVKDHPGLASYADDQRSVKLSRLTTPCVDLCEIEYELTKEDKTQGYVRLPHLMLYSAGYLPYELDPGSIELATLGKHLYYVQDQGLPPYQRLFSYEHPKIVLQRDPDFAGFPKSLFLVVNTEPYGARIYEDGKLVGTAPDTLCYSLKENHYRQGYMSGKDLVVVLFGYKPQALKPRYSLGPDDKYSKEDIHKHELAVLERDPAVPALMLAQPSYAQPSSQSYDAGRASTYEDAKAEYEQTLAAWETAMRNCDNTGLNTDKINEAATGSNWGPLLETLGSLAKQEAARKLLVAKERLDRAKVKLQALEWK